MKNLLKATVNKVIDTAIQIKDQLPLEGQKLIDEGKGLFNEGKDLLNDGKNLVVNLLPPEQTKSLFPIHTLTFVSKGDRSKNLPTCSAIVSIPLPNDESYMKMVKLHLTETFSQIWDDRPVSVSSDQDSKDS